MQAVEPLRRCAAGLQRAARGALDLLLPASCLTCDVTVDQPGQLCADCFRLTNFITEPVCRRCGVPFGYVSAGGALLECAACLETPPVYGRARGALLYDDQTRRIILAFKHGDRTELAPALARHMARAGAGLLREADVLVPVPLHRWRLLKRRYNQAALLARALGRQTGRPVVVDALARVRATESLGMRDALARRAVLDGAITVRARRAARIVGRRVLVVDDVLTSGATAEACARALLGAGALGVDVLAGARVARVEE